MDLENPYVAAQRFLERNDLPMHFLDQVVNFISRSAAGVTLGGSAGASDPFTGQYFRHSEFTKLICEIRNRRLLNIETETR